MNYESILELMKAISYVVFDRCEDRKIWYSCVSSHGVIFSFPIPFEDTVGGVFQRIDHKPMHFMRWIRKEFERQKAEREMIAKAKADWEKEQS